MWAPQQVVVFGMREICDGPKVAITVSVRALEAHEIPILEVLQGWEFSIWCVSKDLESEPMDSIPDSPAQPCR